MSDSKAYIGNDGRYTVFTYGDERLKFIAPYSLERYEKVKNWDNGYLVWRPEHAEGNSVIGISSGFEPS